jgi:transcriptional regulator with XRE-family HTH domain
VASDPSIARAAAQAARDSQPAAPGLGQRVRDRRVNAGLNQTTLAALAGLCRQTVATVERAGTTDLRTIAKLAAALECKSSDLLYGNREEQSCPS